MRALSATEFLLSNTSIYKEFMEERQEVLRHKWLESEKRGYDIGFDSALMDWIIKYRTAWRNWRKSKA